MKEDSGNIGVEWIFLLAMILVYFLIALVKTKLFLSILISFKNVLFRVLPILPFIFGLIFVSNLFLDPSRTKKYLGSESGLKGYLISIFGGIISTGPIYMWYPLLKNLKEKGMKISLVAIFLYNRAIKIPLLPIMIFYFGWSFVILLTILMIFASLINGFVVERLI